MTATANLILGLYLVTLSVLAVYGAHRFATVVCYYRNRRRRAVPQPLPVRLLRVTIQLPLYNEMYVTERLLESVSRIRYPRDLLEIQVLDDSDDETVALARRKVGELRGRGLDAHYVRRRRRVGFKAGALTHGLSSATGELILILDADFIAPPDILEKTVGCFEDPAVGMVQARWGHINRSYSTLTELQAILLDGHFVLEHGGRSRAGRFFNFNGTAGVWRRSAIDDAGGWQADTLTEDLDLSYRAQLRGWRFVFLQDLVAPAELPVEMNAFKDQQHRWAKGSIQTCRKLLPRVLRSPVPFGVKLEAAFHLTANFCSLLMVLLSVLLVAAAIVRAQLGWKLLPLVDLPLILAATLGLGVFYVAGIVEAEPASWRRRLKYVPAAIALGIGLSLNNAHAVIEALAGRQGVFKRTPKLHVERRADDWRGRSYRGSSTLAPLLELSFALYFMLGAYYAASGCVFGPLPFILLFLSSFLYAALVSLLQLALDARSQQV